MLINSILLAVETDGELPDPEEIAFRLRIDKSNAIKYLKEIDYCMEHDASEVLASCKQSARTENREQSVEQSTEAEADTEDKNIMSRNLDEVPKKILLYLNTNANKKFRPVDSNLKLIRARLKEGHSEGDMLWVIDEKIRQWLSSPKFNAYLRPATLFNAEKFNQYIGEKGSVRPMSDKEAFYADLQSEDSPTIIEGDCHVIK